MSKSYSVTGGGNLSIHVREWGNPTGRPLLFIHGWAQSYLCWHKQYENELADDFRIVAIDNRGHGMSSSPLEAENYTNGHLWADDIDAVIQTLNLDRPILVGWSYGGLVIGDYLRYNGTDQISGINFVGATPALNESALGTLIGPGFYENFDAATNSDLAVSLPATLKFLHDCFEVQPTVAEFDMMVAFNALVSPVVKANLAARDLDNKDVLQKIDIPVLVTHGRQDKVVLPTAGDYFLTHCPTAKASWYDGIGHAPFYEDASRFNRELKAFAEDIL